MELNYPVVRSKGLKLLELFLILKNPKILLLDKATSALNVESKRFVQDALGNVMTKRTMVVAHRLTTIRNTDRIAVVQVAKLVEQGTHDELVRSPDTAYSQLIQIQEGAKHINNIEGKDLQKMDSTLHLYGNMSKSSNRRISTTRSTRNELLSHPFGGLLGVILY
ncbi:ABC transporter B family member 9-like [Olea europaea subsp. europaea]|uniref:ABC transporter B family member 9-like n=1 Tax=Olea europaea subsp. europaea TaxID=158383 RepID=A0A8S0T3W4_OLEEU|nr:ABC transporter B family member 9-like [Olea europaea subsp. europaea]